MKKIVSTVIIVIFFTGCFDFPQEKMNNMFGDQHFKTAVALIELHKIRYGEYPETVNEIKFTGDWDKIIYGSVSYEKKGDGYILIPTRGFIGKPNLSYPDEFYQGLGMKNRLGNAELKENSAIE